MFRENLFCKNSPLTPSSKRRIPIVPGMSSKLYLMLMTWLCGDIGTKVYLLWNRPMDCVCVAIRVSLQSTSMSRSPIPASLASTERSHQQSFISRAYSVVVRKFYHLKSPWAKRNAYKTSVMWCAYDY